MMGQWQAQGTKCIGSVNHKKKVVTVLHIRLYNMIDYHDDI